MLQSLIYPESLSATTGLHFSEMRHSFLVPSPVAHARRTSNGVTGGAILSYDFFYIVISADVFVGRWIDDLPVAVRVACPLYVGPVLISPAANVAQGQSPAY